MTSTSPLVKTTPMFEQYLSIKADHPDALLFYRMGDFYELFFEDAVTAARELQITLTSRNSNAADPVPMCGVPHHSSESYVNQLLKKGYKVAICEQLEDPKTAKGLVKRGVTLVRTSGTAVEDASLTAKSHNYLGALYWDAAKNAGGFAWLEFSTGEWSGLHSKREDELWQWVQKMQPRELLLPDLPADLFKIPQNFALMASTPVRLPVRSYFDMANSIDRLLKAQGVQELGAIGLQDKEELARACGALLGYIFQTQKQELSHLSPFSPLDLGRHLIIDEITERNLEIFRRLDGKKGPGTLWHVLDATLTPMGGRLLEERLRHPWRDILPIVQTQEIVTLFHQNPQKRAAVRKVLQSVYDLERLSTRIQLGRATPRDFVSLKSSLMALHDIPAALQKQENGRYPTADEVDGTCFPPVLESMIRRWDTLDDIASLLDSALVESPPPLVTEAGLFKYGFNADLDTLIDLVEHAEQLLQNLLNQEQEQHGLPKLKLGYSRVIGYFFELSKSFLKDTPAHFVRRQTMTNGERFVTPALKELEERIISASDDRKILEHKLFLDLRTKVCAARPRILYMADSIAALDYWQCLAEVAHSNDWNKPVMTKQPELHIHSGRHPVVESLSGSSGFVANDLHMDDKRRLLIITGPNMAGKSTVLRQVALINILAQMGSFVPAQSATIGLADRIFSRVGASDNLAQGQSTFMVEMMETARILRQATKRSLVILDEIGRGTSTYDGLSLAWAVVEDLLKRGNEQIRTLFATHYHELTALEGCLPGLHNMSIAVKEWKGEIVFLHRLVPGPTDKSYGIEVAKLAGVPPPVVLRSKKILQHMEENQKVRRQMETAETLQQLLPGISSDAYNQPAAQELMPERSKEVEHPILIALRDLDADSITPMQALQTISEWKLLWGDKNDA